MDAETNVRGLNADTALFKPNQHLGDAINRVICQAEIDGGVALESLPLGAVLHVQTAHHLYRLENQGEGEVLLSGHPTFCPNPVRVRVNGSTWGTPMIWRRFIGRGMRMEFHHPERGVILTSWIQEVAEVC